MKPTSLSASAVQIYESCGARFLASYINKAQDLSGSAATLGTTVHAALEDYVKSGAYKTPSTSWRILVDLYTQHYNKHFQTRNQFKDGLDMLENWWNRTDLLDGRTVLSCEVKEEFQISGIPFRYIFDRCDELPDGAIEVVDYKSSRIPEAPENLKQKIQVRCYALAAAIKYPNRPAYWVSLDMLRYDLVGVKFTREDNIQTWNYLKEVISRIEADEGKEETLNPECRWCVRRSGCETLLVHAANGGELGALEFNSAIDKRAKLDYARAAIGRVIDSLDEFILQEAEEQEIIEHKTEETELKITVSSRRDIDTERVVKILGSDAIVPGAKVSISWIDEQLKSGGLDDTTRSELRQLIRKKPTAPSVKTKPLRLFGDDE